MPTKKEELAQKIKETDGQVFMYQKEMDRWAAMDIPKYLTPEDWASVGGRLAYMCAVCSRYRDIFRAQYQKLYYKGGADEKI